ncbi:MAG: hypothetical protein EA343_16110 [Nodularia sp. (in: Bacteria)]|nr:MAG: hypothetical protein EA343_16110 [Nodularia sp. (in: cyanobacteria)]
MCNCLCGFTYCGYSPKNGHCRKTMLAPRLGGILPLLEFAESLEVTRIHSVAGLLKNCG